MESTVRHGNVFHVPVAIPVGPAMPFYQIQQCVFDLRAERGSRICDFRRHIVHASAVRTRIRLLLPDCSTVQPGDRSGTVSAIQPAVDNHFDTNSSIRFHIFFDGFTRRHSRIFEYRKPLMVDVHMQSVSPSSVIFLHVVLRECRNACSSIPWSRCRRLSCRNSRGIFDRIRHMFWWP